MYPINRDLYDTIMSSPNRRIEWHGTIVLPGMTIIELDKRNILVDNTSELRMQCSTQTGIDIGGAYSSELTIQCIDLGVDRYALYGGILNLHANIFVDTQTGIDNWGDAGVYTWQDLSGAQWGRIGKGVLQYDFPMGRYIIKEAMQTANKVKITAYDFMTKFDVELPDSMPKNAKSPYAWIQTACNECGVTLGTSRSKLYAMPNGLRAMKFANSDKSIKSWRDIVASAVAVMGANAMMDRNGRLVVRLYNAQTVDDIDPGNRYDSEFSDYLIYYTGIYLSYREKGIEDYYSNADDPEDDTGLAYDLGFNCFMQVDHAYTREYMMKQIINAQRNLKFAPFSVSMPFNPCYDLMDTVRFSGNQADRNRDMAPITSIIWRIGGKMDIACGGENPSLKEAKPKEQTALENTNAGMLGENMFMEIGSAPGQELTIEADTAVKVGTVLFYAKEPEVMYQVAYTATYELSKTSLVIAEIYTDDELVYRTEQNQWVGENTLTVTTGHELEGSGSHTVEIYLTVTESSLDPGGGGVLLAKSVSTNGLYIAADDGVYGYSQVTANVSGAPGYYTQAEDVPYVAPEANASYDVTALSYTASAEIVTG